MESKLKVGLALDYEEVARRLASMSEHDKKKSDLTLPRSSFECKLQHRFLTRKVVPFTKEESRKISELVHLASHNQDLDWETIAKSLESDRTAWECFVAYQTRLRPVVQQKWTLPQDQLLLKYMAAAGPQFVIDSESVSHLATRLFPNKSKANLLTRINHSLVNPNLKRDNWEEEEERKLAVLMKIYRDYRPELQTSTAKVASGGALYLAGTHFPGRSSKSVSDKWNRSLNPEYSTRPFTKEEDNRLLSVMKQQQAVAPTGNSRGESIGWTDLCRQYFPNRHPQRLANRWSEIASDNDILAHSGRKSIIKEKKRKSDNGRPYEVKRERTKVAVASGAALTADDFVLQIVNTKKRKVKD